MITGGRGQLGTDCTQVLAAAHEVISVDLEELDITARSDVAQMVEDVAPDLILNCAAYTRVDACETDRDSAWNVNVTGPRNLALSAQARGSLLIHISTDYVFDGTSRTPYQENDIESPLGVYGKSKARGDERVREILPKEHCIVRTQWLYGLHGKNFIETILGLAATRDHLTVVNDQHGSPTWTVDLAHALVELCKLEARGTYHVTNSGETTWYNLALAALDMADLSHVRLDPISTEQFGAPAPRPAACWCGRRRR